MAHELTFKDGVAEMFSVRETPWHREGHVLEVAPTLEEALTLAGMDFEVEKHGVYLRRETPDGDEYFVESKKAFVTERTDTHEELGSVGADYTVLQNVDAFKVVQPMIDEGLAAFETGGSLRGGADVWLQMKFNLPPESFAAVYLDEIGVVPFGIFANNHSGRRGVLLGLTPRRVVCANTLAWAEAGGAGSNLEVIRHTQSVEARCTEAAMRLWGGIIEKYERAAEAYSKLRDYYLDEALFRELVLNVAVPDPRENKRWNPEAKMANSVVARYERKVDEISRLWTEGDGHTGDHSAWEAYNGLVQAVDHDNDLFPVRGGVYRTASLLNGRLAAIKQDVFENLTNAYDDGVGM